MPARRLARKLRQIGCWVNSVRGPADWPAAVLLGFLRTRPLSGEGAFARAARWLLPYVWVHPRSLGTYALRLNPANAFQFFIYEEVFINNAYDLDQVNFSPDVVIDCGAFEGYFSLQVSARYPDAKVVAFEPNEDNFAGLLANLERNGLQIDARREAVSTRNGTASFSGGGCGGRLASDAEKGRDGLVTTVDLRDVIARMSPHRLLLKIDVEGEELAVLPAVVPMLPPTCALFFEWHHDERGFQAAHSLLTDAGFVVWRRQTRGPFEDGILYVDAFALRADSASVLHNT